MEAVRRGVLHGGVLGGGQGPEAGQVHGRRGSGAMAALEHPTVMHDIHEDWDFGLNTDVALLPGMPHASYKHEHIAEEVNLHVHRHYHAVNSRQPRETDNIYSCDLAAYRMYIAIVQASSHWYIWTKCKLNATNPAHRHIPLKPMLHPRKNRRGYLVQGLDDGVGVLESLGLASEVTGDGLP